MRFRVVLFSIVALCAVGASPATHKLVGHMLPASVTAGAKPVQLENPVLSLAVRLKMPNEAELADFIQHLYTAGDPLFEKFIAPEEFANRFGATKAHLNSVTKYFGDLGCLILYEDPSHLLVDVQCAQSTLESAFSIKIFHWQTPAQEMLQTIDTDPSIPEGLPIAAINGLTNISRHPHYLKKTRRSRLRSAPVLVGACRQVISKSPTASTA